MSRRRKAIAVSLGALMLAFALGMMTAVAKSSSFTVTVPPFGSQTGAESWITVDNGRDIDIKYSQNPQDSQIKPVRCSDGKDISGYKFVRAKDHSLQTLATLVLHGTCFKLNIDTPGNTWGYDTFVGTVYF
jgi:hypothetical protein